MTGQIRVGLVDDHPVVVGGLEAAFTAAADIEIVATAATLAEAARLLDRDDIDVVLLDVRLPDGNGLELLARTAGRRRPAIIVLSSFQARQYTAAAVRFGAHGFMLKTAPTEVLVSAIRRAAEGRSSFSPEQRRPNGYVRLTPRERELVRQVMAARTNEEIAVAFRIHRRSVETELSRLYERLGVATRMDLALRAEREGWLEIDSAAAVAETAVPAR